MLYDNAAGSGRFKQITSEWQSVNAINMKAWMTTSKGPPEDPSWTIEEPSQVQLGAMVFATLVFFIPKLPRPSRRAVAVIDAPAIRSAQWRLGAPLGPPRLSLLAIA